jgi:hypothetical protein
MEAKMKYDFSNITEVKLAHGSHDAPEQGMCFMEMVAWFAGEDHSDKPKCACRVLGAYGINLNDNMPDALRDRMLKPLVPAIAGTIGTRDDQQARAEFLVRWTVNRILPISLRAVGCNDAADQCEKAVSVQEVKDAADAAKAAGYAAYAADAADAAKAAAYAAAYAADAADAADAAKAAAYAAAYAAYAAYAADAAKAAAYAADAAAYAADAEIFEIAVEGLRQAILIGPHEGFNSMINLAQRHDELRALVAA